MRNAAKAYLFEYSCPVFWYDIDCIGVLTICLPEALIAEVVRVKAVLLRPVNSIWSPLAATLTKAFAEALADTAAARRLAMVPRGAHEPLRSDATTV